jgi:hypothetical protein
LAVTVANETPFLVLDASDHIVEVGPAAHALYGSLLGRTLWDRFPEAEPLVTPHYARARQTQEPVEFVQFFRGQVTWIRAEPSGPRLTVTWRMLLALDTLTLDRLRDSIGRVIAILEDWEDHDRRGRLRESLRVIEGGVSEDDVGPC